MILTPWGPFFGGWSDICGSESALSKAQWPDPSEGEKPGFLRGCITFLFLYNLVKSD